MVNIIISTWNTKFFLQNHINIEKSLMTIYKIISVLKNLSYKHGKITRKYLQNHINIVKSIYLNRYIFKSIYLFRIFFI